MISTGGQYSHVGLIIVDSFTGQQAGVTAMGKLFPAIVRSANTSKANTFPRDHSYRLIEISQ